MTEPSMVEVLEKHESSRPAFIRETDGGDWHRGVSACSCGETFTGTHRTHVAAALAAAGFGHVEEAAKWLAEDVGYPFDMKKPVHMPPEALWEALVTHVHKSNDRGWSRLVVSVWLLEEATRGY